MSSSRSGLKLQCDDAVVRGITVVAGLLMATSAHAGGYVRLSGYTEYVAPTVAVVLASVMYR